MPDLHRPTLGQAFQPDQAVGQGHSTDKTNGRTGVGHASRRDAGAQRPNYVAERHTRNPCVRL